jgi:hypothetical protein
MSRCQESRVILVCSSGQRRGAGAVPRALPREASRATETSLSVLAQTLVSPKIVHALTRTHTHTMMSYFFTGAAASGGSGGGGGGGVDGGGGVCFSPTVEVVAADGTVRLREMNADGGFFDTSGIAYESDGSMIYDGDLMFLDAVQANEAAAPKLDHQEIVAGGSFNALADDEATNYFDTAR